MSNCSHRIKYAFDPVCEGGGADIEMSCGTSARVDIQALQWCRECGAIRYLVNDARELTPWLAPRSRTEGT